MIERRNTAPRPPALQALAIGLLAALAFAGCGGPEPADKAGDAGKADPDADAGAGAPLPGYTSALPSPYVQPAWAAEGWRPKRVPLLDSAVRRRGLREVRGLVHAHTAYSHDACDDKPFDEKGVINSPCVEDFRRDLCAVGHDYVFLTDHPTHFRDHPFPDVLLYDKSRGDTLLQRGSVTFGNRMACGDGRSVLLLPGTEGGMMPVGLDGHIQDPELRKKAYGGDDQAARDLLVAQGARILAQHTEDWTAVQLTEPGWSGFEMYNLHANMMAKMKEAALLIPVLIEPSETLEPDLILLALLTLDPRYDKTWAQVARSGVRRVTTMGTDCHRNTFTLLLSDKERVDSYRRMMIWFSNHLLIGPEPDGSYDDRHLEVALDARRLFGVFEVFGHAEGFDARVESGKGANAAVVEIGGEVSAASQPTLLADTPHVAMLPPGAEAPLVRSVVLRADPEGWTEVASGDGRISLPLKEPGAYRVEVRIVPRHLRKLLGSKVALADQEFPWVLANAFYVVP